MLRKETWESWEGNILEIFSTALRELIVRGPLPERENELNRTLAVLVRKCRKEWCKANGRELQGHPIYHAKGQPGSLDEPAQTGENKEPEFTWGFTDYLDDIDKNYHVECKRLKEDKRHDYCNGYVTNGIRRFVEKEWSYGIGCESGLMIGYIQGMEFTDILHWVNHYTEKHLFPVLILEGRWNKNDVSRLENVLDRPYVLPSPFKLVHLWVDLRANV